jgi:hypothetical protein
MRTAYAIALSASLLAAAGCLGTGATVGSGSTNAGPPPPAWSEAQWSGSLRVGAAYEAPSHVGDTNAATRSVWSPSFHYATPRPPRDLEVRMDWNATLGQLELMVIVPRNGSAPEQSVTSPMADRGPLCVKVPAEELRAGNYSIMAHSTVAVDARFAFTVAALGTAGQAVDEPHAPSARDFLGAGLGALARDPAGLPGALGTDASPGLPCTHLTG